MDKRIRKRLTQEGLPLPVRLQTLQPRLLILLRPFPYPAFTAPHQLPDLRGGDPAAIQSHRLQASQLVGIARLQFGLLQRLLLFIGQLKVSFSHTHDYISGDFFFGYP